MWDEFCVRLRLFDFFVFGIGDAALRAGVGGFGAVVGVGLYCGRGGLLRCNLLKFHVFAIGFSIHLLALSRLLALALLVGEIIEVTSDAMNVEAHAEYDAQHSEY